MTIRIEELTFYTIIGILPFERKNKQRVIINCKIKYDYKKNNFVNYAEIAQDIEEIMKKKKFKLLEDAVLHLTKYIKSNYNVKKVSLTIIKPDILNNCTVSLSK